MAPRYYPLRPLTFAFQFSTSLLLLATPVAARAELSVRVSVPAPGLYQSVLVTAEEPGAEADTAVTDVTAALTMADPRDRRRTQPLLPAGPHRWEGRFTPELIGHYTGTVVLERGDEREIGLVPLLRVKPSIRRGFLRSIAPRGRMFYACSGGLFPMGVVLDDAPQFTGSWNEEFARLHRQGVNYARIELPWTDSADSAPGEAMAVVDQWLQAAEENGVYVQLRLARPAGPEAAAAYEPFLRAAVARWSPYPSLAAWELDPGASAVDDAALRRLIASVRAADPYRHLITEAGVAPGLCGADFVSDPISGDSGLDATGGICTAGADGDAARLRRGLLSPGLGLPLVRYRPGGDPAVALAGLPEVYNVAREIPWWEPPRLAAETAAGTLRCVSYGSTLVALIEAGQDAGSGAPSLTVRGVPGTVRVTTCAADGRLETKPVQSASGSLAFTCPNSHASALFVCVCPPPARPAVALRSRARFRPRRGYLGRRSRR